MNPQNDKLIRSLGDVFLETLLLTVEPHAGIKARMRQHFNRFELEDFSKFCEHVHDLWCSEQYQIVSDEVEGNADETQEAENGGGEETSQGVSDPLPTGGDGGPENDKPVPAT